ncbi:MAG: hypothetical protein KGH72_05395 [Candidatus Micrarchaeota archaeon]|nr:hypothetical protein [Candidatus Micrarchaeota archaeon]
MELISSFIIDIVKTDGLIIAVLAAFLVTVRLASGLDSGRALWEEVVGLSVLFSIAIGAHLVVG